MKSILCLIATLTLSTPALASPALSAFPLPIRSTFRLADAVVHAAPLRQSRSVHGDTVTIVSEYRVLERFKGRTHSHVAVRQTCSTAPVPSELSGYPNQRCDGGWFEKAPGFNNGKPAKRSTPLYLKRSGRGYEVVSRIQAGAIAEVSPWDPTTLSGQLRLLRNLRQGQL